MTRETFYKAEKILNKIDDLKETIDSIKKTLELIRKKHKSDNLPVIEKKEDADLFLIKLLEEKIDILEKEFETL